MKIAKIEGSEKEVEVRRPASQASRLQVLQLRTHVPHKLYSNNYLSIRKLFPDCDLKLPMHKASPRDRYLSFSPAYREYRRQQPHMSTLERCVVQVCENMTTSRTKGPIRGYEGEDYGKEKERWSCALRVFFEKGGSEDEIQQRLLRRPAFSRRGSSTSAHFAQDRDLLMSIATHENVSQYASKNEPWVVIRFEASRTQRD